MKNLSEMTSEEVAELNAKTEAELKVEIEINKVEKTRIITSALSLLTESIETETIEILFGGKGTITVLANPPKAVLKKLAAIASKAQKVESGEIMVSDDEEKKVEEDLAGILEQIVVKPKASKKEWKSYPYLDEVAARVIYYLGMDMARRQEEKRQTIESFRKDGRGSANPGDLRAVEHPTILAGKTE